MLLHCSACLMPQMHDWIYVPQAGNLVAAGLVLGYLPVSELVCMLDTARESANQGEDADTELILHCHAINTAYWMHRHKGAPTTLLRQRMPAVHHADQMQCSIMQLHVMLPGCAIGCAA